MGKPKKEKSPPPITSVKVVGVGGAGGNAVSRMSKDFVRGVEFIAINTDQQDLDECIARRKLYIGRSLTRGMGTGMNPDLGRQAAEENRSEISEALRGADIIFITAGLGGGTGTGASPVVAEVARQSGALTIAVVTKPFIFEGSQRERIASDGVAKLKDKVDALIVVPNDRIFSIISKETPILKAFVAIDEVLRNALRGVVELILTPGIINVDFADVRAILQDAGSAIVGIGVASGPERAVQAVAQALNNPLLDATAEGAHGVLLGIAGGRDMRMTEISDAAKLVAQTVDPTAKIIFGAYYDRNLKPNQLKVTLIATNFANGNGNGGGNSLFTTSGLYSSSTPATRPISVPVSPATANPAKSDDSVWGETREKKAPSYNNPAPTPKSGSHLAHDNSGDKGPLPPRGDMLDPRNKDRNQDTWDIPAFLRRKKK